MDSLVVILGGIACGIVGSLPSAILLEGVLKREMRVRVAQGLVSILVSFGFMSAALVVVRMAAKSEVFAFGVAMMVSFLLFWGAEALRAWVAHEGGQGSEGRN